MPTQLTDRPKCVEHFLLMFRGLCFRRPWFFTTGIAIAELVQLFVSIMWRVESREWISHCLFDHAIVSQSVRFQWDLNKKNQLKEPTLTSVYQADFLRSHWDLYWTVVKVLTSRFRCLRNQITTAVSKRGCVLSQVKPLAQGSPDLAKFAYMAMINKLTFLSAALYGVLGWSGIPKSKGTLFRWTTPIQSAP